MDFVRWIRVLVSVQHRNTKEMKTIRKMQEACSFLRICNCYRSEMRQNILPMLFLSFYSDKLTQSHLKIKRVQPARCGPFRLFCLGPSYVSKNIDLSYVDDVEVMGVPAPCCQRTFCCSRGKDLIEVDSRSDGKGNGRVFLILEEGHGEPVANLILNQVEESQKMERGI